MRRRAALLTTGLLAATLLVHPRAALAQTGGLSISVPGTAALGSTTPGGTLTAQLGVVQVSAGGSIGQGIGWRASVSTSGFAGPSGATIPGSSVTYTPGPATNSGGVSGCTAGPAGTLATTRTAYDCSGALISSGAKTTWNPTLQIQVGAQAVAGAYTGTVTHSVA